MDARRVRVAPAQSRRRLGRVLDAPRCLVRLRRNAFAQRRTGSLGAERFLADPSGEPEPRVLAFRTGAIGRDLLRSALARLLAPLWPFAAAGYALLPARRAQRLEQLLADCSYWQGVRHRAGEIWPRIKTGGAVILAYHALTVGREQCSDYVLRAQKLPASDGLAMLARYNLIRLDKIVSCLRDGTLPLPRSVAISAHHGATR